MDHALVPDLLTTGSGFAAGARLTSGYDALRQSAAWIDLSKRGRLRITGEDRARLLNAMTTNQVQSLRPGQGCYVFFLNAQGRILGDANIFCFADHLLLDTEPETRQKLSEHLDRYIIADDVTVEDVTGTTAAIAVEGPQAEAVLAALGAEIPAHSPLEPLPWASWGERTVARVSSTGSPGFCIFTAAGDKPAFLTQLAGATKDGLMEATPDDARTVRIEHGHPRYGEEITERYLVQETGQLQAVNFNKGCYLGQEIVERVRSRAQIHRLLHGIEIDTSEVPAVGARLTSGEADAGEIVSAVYSPAMERVAAMAYVRIQFDKPGTELSCGAAPARISTPRLAV
ncbi:MAG TPA: glycine cleavage T C-terminal barrel domain-containing protein [Bryobacteraceae bacterium]|jgi:aminomethyltransferase